PEERPAPPPLPVAPVSVSSPPPAPAASGCKWGKARRGCNPNPAIGATGMTVLAASAVAVMGAGWRCYARPQEGRGLGGVPIALGTAGTLAWTPVAGYLWHQVAHPPGEPPVQPTVSLSGGGATLGVTGAF